MKKAILILLLFLINFVGISQSTLTINTIAVTDVDPINRGDTFNVEIKYQSDSPVKAKIQFWIVFFNTKEYDAWFLNEQIDVLEVNEGEENKEKIAAIEVKFPEIPKYKDYKPNGFGKHDIFKLKSTSKLLKGEKYQLRIYATRKDKFINATKPTTNINVRSTSLENDDKVFFISPNIIKVK